MRGTRVLISGTIEFKFMFRWTLTLINENVVD